MNTKWQVVVKNSAGGQPSDWQMRREHDSKIEALEDAFYTNRRNASCYGTGGYGNTFAVRYGDSGSIIPPHDIAFFIHQARA